MARYAGGGKTTVESCPSIDVLDWHRRGYLQSPRWFSWAWTRDGEQIASINVETQYRSVTLKYRSRSYGEDWSDVEQRVAIMWTPCRFGGERPWFVCEEAAQRLTRIPGIGVLTATALVAAAMRKRSLVVATWRLGWVWYRVRCKSMYLTGQSGPRRGGCPTKMVVRHYAAGSIFSLAIGKASRKVCIGVFPKHHRP